MLRERPPREQWAPDPITLATPNITPDRVRALRTLCIIMLMMARRIVCIVQPSCPTAPVNVRPGIASVNTHPVGMDYGGFSLESGQKRKRLDVE